MRLYQTLIAVLLACAASMTIAAPRLAIDDNFPDPAVLRASDGWYYVYATQGEHAGRMQNIQAARSRDMKSWQRLADVLPVKPGWAAQTQDFWAPHVHAASDFWGLRPPPT